MARAIWSGSISFGMVSIPVKLYGATESRDISFNQLHRKCRTRVKQLRYCPTCDREVEWNELVRGFEYAKDEYVMLTDEDLAALPLASAHTIELDAFVEREEIDPTYYEKTYYLEPDRNAEKPYALLLQALEKKKLTALATIAIRKKEQLCALRPSSGTLMLETLFYPDEIRAHTTDLKGVKVNDRELDMAFALIDLLTKPFQPEEYHDHYREALAKLIDAKLDGKQVEKAPAAGGAKVIDLADALKKSLAAAKKGGASRPAKGQSRAKAPARAKAQRKAG